MFELLKIPYIRENFPKNMVLNRSREAQNHSLDICTNLESQKSATKTLPPFLLNFEILQRNVHKCMIDWGESLNVMPVSVCKNLNATWESCPKQIMHLDRSRLEFLGELKNIILTLFFYPKIHQAVGWCTRNIWDVVN